MEECYLQDSPMDVFHVFYIAQMEEIILYLERELWKVKTTYIFVKTGFTSKWNCISCW